MPFYPVNSRVGTPPAMQWDRNPRLPLPPGVAPASSSSRSGRHRDEGGAGQHRSVRIDVEGLLDRIAARSYKTVGPHLKEPTRTSSALGCLWPRWLHPLFPLVYSITAYSSDIMTLLRRSGKPPQDRSPLSPEEKPKGELSSRWERLSWGDRAAELEIMEGKKERGLTEGIFSRPKGRDRFYFATFPGC